MIEASATPQRGLGVVHEAAATRRKKGAGGADLIEGQRPTPARGRWQGV